MLPDRGADTSRITYKEAANLLGVAEVTIKRAIANGILTPLPRSGVTRYLLREQVELFRGKPFVLDQLSREERKRWEEYRDSINPKQTNESVQLPVNPERLGDELGHIVADKMANAFAKYAPDSFIEVLKKKVTCAS
jgi:excisionase family DNA binding protein